METPTLGSHILSEVESLPNLQLKLRWYLCVIVNLSALNYPDVVPEVWRHLERHLFPGMNQQERFDVARKVREALVKSVGIVGAAKTGTTMRTLAKYIPGELADTESPRSQEDPAVAAARGKAYHTRIYARNPTFNPSSTAAASPDYAWVIRTLFYGHIFSFNAVIDDFETGFVIVAALLGIDCQLQMRHHMIGLQLNGAKKQEIEAIRDTCVGIAKHLGVVFRGGLRKVEVPDVPAGAGAVD